MRIIQVLPTVVYGDAVSNDAMAVMNVIQDMGYETGIYAMNIDKRLIGKEGLRFPKDLPELEEEDILIYHGSTGDPMNYQLPGYGGRKVMIYHNVTPASFLRGYSGSAVRLAEAGERGIRFLRNHIEYCIADSDYNRHELREMGYRCPIDVCPILIPFQDYDQEPDPEIMGKYSGDGWTNLLFVGRIAPNKKQEDVIRAFRAYRNEYQENSRLFLVGNAKGMERYQAELEALVEREKLTGHVVFTGSVSFRALLAYYHLADAFVCMSEHEGFCVPLVEAMYFDQPIVAFDSSAIPETLGNAGVLLKTKNPKQAADALHQALKNESLRTELKEGRIRRLQELSYETVRKQVQTCLEKMAARGAER